MNWPPLLRHLVTLIVGAFVAYGASQYSAAQREARLKTAEGKIEVLERNIVPRSEQDARWKAIEGSLKQIQTDVREGRNTQTEILLKLAQSPNR